jgi:hypothetical protein
MPSNLPGEIHFKTPGNIYIALAFQRIPPVQYIIIFLSPIVFIMFTAGNPFLNVSDGILVHSQMTYFILVMVPCISTTTVVSGQV